MAPREGGRQGVAGALGGALTAWAALTLGVIGAARADGGPRVELELGAGWAEDGQGGVATIWSPMVTISGRAGPTGAVWLRTGATAARSEAGGLGLAAANLTLGWAEQLGLGVVGKVAFAIPTARRGGGLDALAESGGRAVRGHWEAWQWLGDHAAVVGSLTWVMARRGWLLEAQPTVAFMIPTQARPGDDGVARGEGLALEGRVRVAGRLTGSWWWGLATSLAWTPTVTRNATAWSLAPELRWAGAGGAAVALGAVLNLDAPWGPSWADSQGLPEGEVAAGRRATGLRVTGAWRF
jgi:hypothetical protein